MQKFTIAVLVYNRFGVLNRVTSMFRRRRFNISSLSVSETETEQYSRITLTSYGSEQEKHQLIEQLNKLEDVCFIKELKDSETVGFELLLIKVKNEPETRSQIRDAADSYGAETVDFTRDAVILKLTGSTRRINAFIDLMRDYSILEICRTGVASLERGNTTISKVNI
ncbi:MAG: acetolactate synthase small subunit [Monoglobales bacterium]